jgi:sugar lactone lactonase YvrE
VVHELTPDGRAKDRRAIDVAPGFPDGLAVDEEGVIWVALYGSGCVARYRPDGAPDGSLEVPASSVTSLCFGGADRRDLYVVSADNSDDPERGGSIFRTRVDVPGLAAPLARI